MFVNVIFVDLVEQNEKVDDLTTEDLNNATEVKTSSPPSGLPTFLKPATTGAATLITNTIKPIGMSIHHNFCFFLRSSS